MKAIDLISCVEEPGTVILDAQKPVRDNRHSWLLRGPVRVFETRETGAVRGILEEVQHLLETSDCVAAGYIAYEAAGAFGLRTRPSSGELPLVWLGVYQTMEKIRETDWPALQDAGPRLDGTFNLTGAEYVRAVERVRAYIGAGDTYQVNLACKFRFDLPDFGDAGHGPFALYCRLRRAHPVPYGAYLNLGDAQILSFSPELFLRRKKHEIATRPMKGTAPRGLSAEEDDRLARALRASTKNRAENVMIVDLMRNDLGRVCEIGSIEVPRLFDCERYASVHQLTSTVTGRVRAGAGLAEILEAAFPCGSITGAPKRRTMEIITEMEKEPRGVYCGAIGRFGPGTDFLLNVAIRTLTHREGKCELGVGSGITWGSSATEEWEETRMKSRFAGAAPREFRLIETLLLEPSGDYAFLDAHLRRLWRSARYWDFRFSRKKILKALEETAAGERREGVPAEPSFTSGRIVRVALDRKGDISVSTRPLTVVPRPVRILLYPEPVDARDVFLYHKTDRRALYDRALAEARSAGFAEAIFRNRRGCLTEGCFTNLFVELEGRWATPPVSDGLLPGIWREAFRRAHRAAECSLTLEDLARASRIIIGNSVRGAIAVVDAWSADADSETPR